MNSLGLIYREITLAKHDIVTISEPNKVYKDVRHALKPYFNELKLKANNINGESASRFVSRLPRYRTQWLDFLVTNYLPGERDYPSELNLLELGILKNTEIGDINYWKTSILNEIAEKRLYLMLGLRLMGSPNQTGINFLSFRVPSKSWPLDFELIDSVITNAPICQYLRHQSHVLV
jgi:hypothetical protein